MFTDTITTRDVLTFSLHLQNNIKQTAETEISSKLESSADIKLSSQPTSSNTTWLKNNDGTHIGVYNKNPILNTIRISKSFILLN